MTEVRIPRHLINQVLQHTQSAATEEICGLLGSRDDAPTRCYPIKNVSPESKSRFCMDPQGLVDALRQMREAQEQLFAIYHSHPTSPAVPSATDLVENQYPDVLHLIASLNTKGVIELRGYQLKGTTVTEIRLVV